MSWDSRFEEPIVLPYGIRLASLRAAIIHLVVTIPSAERSMPAVLTAAEMLTNAAEHGGSIELAGGKPHGTRAVLRLPAAEEEAVAGRSGSATTDSRESEA